MDIFLVRHGEAAASWAQSSDPGLSKLGKQQAVLAAQHLGPDIHDDVQLLSSPLARARETAAPLADKLGLAVQLEDVFREIPSPVPLAQRQTWLREFMQQSWQDQPRDLLAWRTAAWQHVLDFDRPSVVFTHFLVINAIVGQVMEHPKTLCFMPDNASITRLRHTGVGLELVALGKEMETIVN